MNAFEAIIKHEYDEGEVGELRLKADLYELDQLFREICTDLLESYNLADIGRALEGILEDLWRAVENGDA